MVSYLTGEEDRSIALEARCAGGPGEFVDEQSEGLALLAFRSALPTVLVGLDKAGVQGGGEVARDGLLGQLGYPGVGVTRGYGVLLWWTHVTLLERTSIEDVHCRSIVQGVRAIVECILVIGLQRKMLVAF